MNYFSSTDAPVMLRLAQRRRALRLSLSALGIGLSDRVSAQTMSEATIRTHEDYPAVVRGQRLEFPRDHGSHPRFRIEWWYLTGWLGAPGASPDALGIQITFFRVRTGHSLANPSQFSPAQLLFAHVAIADPAKGRLIHLEQTARPGFGWAEATEGDTGLRIGRWSLNRGPADHYHARIADRSVDLDLNFIPQGPPILQGDRGFSPKGEAARQASYYYSRPALRTHGRVNGRYLEGLSWFDHEWSSELLDPEAQGWDWAGLHLDDGRALMVFRIRDRQHATRWTQHRWISPAEIAGALASAVVLGPASHQERVRFEPLREWRSPRTGVRWPVAIRITIGAVSLALEPLFDDQELDARGGTGVLYWEGAVRVLDPESRRIIGRGYLELTGYGDRLRI